MYKIKIDKETCIGCNACESTCDNFFLENDKAKVKRDKIGEKEYASNKKAEDICPTRSIKISKIK